MLGGTSIWIWVGVPYIGVPNEADAVPELEPLTYAVTELLLMSSRVPLPHPILDSLSERPFVIGSICVDAGRSGNYAGRLR